MTDSTEILRKPYLNAKVSRAIDAADNVRQNYNDAISALQNARQTRDNLLAEEEKAQRAQLDEALADLEQVQAEIAKQANASSQVFETARGAEAKLRMAKRLPFLSKERRETLQKSKQSEETLRYVALARYLLRTVAAGNDDEKSSLVRGSGTSSSETPNLIEELSQTLSVDESDLSEDEKGLADEFKQRLVALVNQLQSDRQKYEQALVDNKVLAMRLDQLDEAAAIAQQAIDNAESADPDPRLQRLRAELSQFKALEERLQQTKAQRKVESLELQMQTTVQEIVRLVHGKRSMALEQLLARLASSVRKQLAEKRQLSAAEAEELRESLQAVQSRREDLAATTEKRIMQADLEISEMEQTLSESQDLYADTLKH